MSKRFDDKRWLSQHDDALRRARAALELLLDATMKFDSSLGPRALARVEQIRGLATEASSQILIAETPFTIHDDQDGLSVDKKGA